MLLLLVDGFEAEFTALCSLERQRDCLHHDVQIDELLCQDGLLCVDRGEEDGVSRRWLDQNSAFQSSTVIPARLGKSVLAHDRGLLEIWVL